MTLIILIVTILAIMYSPRYVYRLARYHVADVYDYKHFENRVIRASDSTFSFPICLDELAEKSLTSAIIVIREDTVLYEKYFNGFSRNSYFHSQSMAKSFISTLNGFAIEDGYIKSVEDPMTVYIPELLKRDSRFERITIKNLMMMLCFPLTVKKQALNTCPVV